RTLLWGIFRSFFRRNRTLHCTHLVMGLSGYFLHRIRGIPYVVWTYGLEVNSFSKRWVKPILQNADSVLTISELTKKHLLTLGVPASRIVKVCPGVNHPPEIRPLEGRWEKIQDRHSLHHCKTLLTVGSLTKLQRYKGIDMVLQALPTILASVPQTRYLVVGSGDDAPYLRELAQRLGIAVNVHFLGEVSSEELSALYAHCDIFVMPSREILQNGRCHYEGFGIVYLEASAFGRPVIGGNGSGAEEAILHDETGFLIDPLDIEQLAECALRLLKDAELARRLGEKGRKRALGEFTWDRAAARLIGLLEREVS
ncbi:MAG: glycosyltransferase family 4 protein, partial [Candidatus Binatia bacterium]